MPDRIRKALDALAQGNFGMGEAWHAAHDLAQAHEGEPVYDRLHALCHRIEGDRGNAAYWYRRAGVPTFEGAVEEEAKAIIAALDNE